MAETAAPLGADSERLQTPALLLPKKSLLRQLIKDRTALVGLVILAIVFAAAVAAPVIAPHNPHDQDVVNRYAPPSSEHLLGTDNLGRDNLSRLMYGARVSLFSALAVGVAILLIGISVGLLSGFVGGFIDGLLMRIVDVLLAFPSLLLALAITGMLGPGLFHLLIGMTAVWWTEYARVMRGLVLSMKERPFVESARALGLPAHRVALRHILPNIVSPVVVLGTLRTGQLLLALSALSFLGLGVQPPTAEWGAMLSEGQNYLASAPQLMLYPGVAITISALGFNLLGDGLRDVLDPTLR
jgi:peptide/nickel transport system permease protein